MIKNISSLKKLKHSYRGLWKISILQYQVTILMKSYLNQSRYLKSTKKNSQHDCKHTQRIEENGLQRTDEKNQPQSVEEDSDEWPMDDGSDDWE